MHMTIPLPDHLGGHLNRTHTDRGTLNYLMTKYGIRSMLDIGCGPGGMVELGLLRDLDAYGIDGDFTLDYSKELRSRIIQHDFTRGAYDFKRTFDLGWSVEFLEHVEEKYQDNYMAAFSACKYVIATAAPPGYPGHHHVNCREESYWHEVFGRHGFLYDDVETKNIRQFISTMQKPFMQRTGMFFRKSILNEIN